MLTISGYQIEQWQRCKRPLVISQTHTFTKWRPQSLLGMSLRWAVFNLSNGMAPEVVTARAVNYFMDSAKNPGLDVSGVDTYALAMDYCAIIRNFIEYLSRTALLTLRAIPNTSISKDLSWQFLSHIDDSGVLHRWKFVDYIDDDPTAELHSWEVFGDMAAADAPMTLHLVSIGQRRQQHQHTPWCKVYAHPSIPSTYQFQHRGGGKLEGAWKPVWFSGNSKNTAKQWVDMMERDNVIDTLIRHVSVKELSNEHLKLFERDVVMEGEMMVSVVESRRDARSLPFSRYACDNPYACPHQLFCYNTRLTLDNSGLYTRKSKEDANVATAVGASS